jgi:hypothetical protein
MVQFISGAITGITVTYGKPLVDNLAKLPDLVTALSEAVIDKAYLTWVDVNQLMAAFPERVKMLGDNVILQGPVAIISSVNPTHRLFAKCMLGLASGALTYLLFRARTPKTINHLPMLSDSIAAKTRRYITISRIFSLLSAGLGFYLAGRCLPTQPGVYFLGQGYFHPFNGIEA